MGESLLLAIQREQRRFYLTSSATLQPHEKVRKAGRANSPSYLRNLRNITTFIGTPPPYDSTALLSFDDIDKREPDTTSRSFYHKGITLASRETTSRSFYHKGITLASRELPMHAPDRARVQAPRNCPRPHGTACLSLPAGELAGKKD